MRSKEKCADTMYAIIVNLSKAWVALGKFLSIIRQKRIISFSFSEKIKDISVRERAAS